MTHNDHCYVTNRSNLRFAVYFLNMLTDWSSRWCRWAVW